MARLKVSFRSVAFLPVALLAAMSPAVAQSNDITQVPVFDGTFGITEDVTVSVSKLRDGARALFSTRETVSMVGELEYQACDKTICYPPASVPVKWELQVRPLDLKRSPRAMQQK